MPRIPIESPRLLRVGKASNQVLANWREGVSLAKDSGVSINDLKCHVAVARWNLAVQHRRDGNALMRLTPPLYRSAISRFYYSMYHALRSASFMYHDGDDHEAHSTLPSHLPGDFPSASTWQNSLKSARLSRNSADYDPYPNGSAHWRARATALKADADALIGATRAYLISKGCTIR